ncbi:pre-mycofactocin synthase MftD [Actinoallomurus iriomotensis]|uniref:Mycofactocin system heme/flavin oxidoreductase MftD n=1 Tax=Actinoallomurus iriomotensis TaxID=478107 RepID=A0A9W6VUE0_9ACTN|nr:pre-mycofactocin synthase MftD [Actinoallomurus iriomotensis]GLY80049.1 putative mycofactocin system heme/flavin oxidoreductase MftD [Actinoallomurus iriomotensis]
MASKVRFNNLAEAERLAKRKLPRAVWLAVKAGNEQGWTLRENIQAFNELGFSPTIFDRPTSFDTKTTILGIDIDFPVVVSPVGAQAIHPDGEVGVARAAARAGTATGLSSWAADSVQDVVQANPNTIFQLYWVGTRDQIEKRVEAARAAGAKALIVTLDWSHTPRRDWGVPPSPPSRLDLATMVKLAPEALSRPVWFGNYLRRGRIPELKVPNLFGAGGQVPYFGAAWADFEATPPPTWDDVKWLRELWGGPFMVKGVNTIKDAKLCVDLGADAISLSNHGGNNIDGSPSPLRYLPSILDALNGQIDVMVDGGIRRGSDVVKALALGAKAVFAGRALLYGLAVGGEEGAYKALTILRDGIRETMYGIGRANIHDLDRADLMVLNSDFFVPPAA